MNNTIALFGFLMVFTFVVVAQVDPKKSKATEFRQPELCRMPVDSMWFFKRLNYSSAQIATILRRANHPTIEFVSVKDSTQQNDFWLVIQRESGSTQFTKLSNLERNEKGKFKGSVEFELFENNYDEYGLDIVVDTAQNVISYRWIGAKAFSVSSDDIPVANPSLIKVGKRMPDLSVNSLAHKKQMVSKTKKHTVVINWWAISCPPCIEEMPDLNRLVEKYGDKGVKFIAIAWNNETDIRKFLRKNRFDYSHFVFNERALSIFGGSYPRSVVVDRDGIVVYDFKGVTAESTQNLENAISRTLAKNK